MRNKMVLIICIVFGAFAVIIGAFAIYAADYYRADVSAIEAFSYENEVEIAVLDNGTKVFKPEEPVAGFIFYPGGKVEYTAYEPLMKACASEGILCVLLEMPFNLAVLDVNAADGICDAYPEIEKWYIGGHSLGGSMAASYADKNADDFNGLILLGSYSTADITDTSLKALSVYGSEDSVLNREKYDKYRHNLPNDLTEVEIDGGCHAYFGMYGAQDGDGIPTVTNEEQICITVDAVIDFMCLNEE